MRQKSLASFGVFVVVLDVLGIIFVGIAVGRNNRVIVVGRFHRIAQLFELLHLNVNQFLGLLVERR